LTWIKLKLLGEVCTVRAIEHNWNVICILLLGHACVEPDSTPYEGVKFEIDGEEGVSPGVGTDKCLEGVSFNVGL